MVKTPESAWTLRRKAAGEGLQAGSEAAYHESKKNRPGHACVLARKALVPS
jgi:hypothetical protein